MPELGWRESIPAGFVVTENWSTVHSEIATLSFRDGYTVFAGPLTSPRQAHYTDRVADLKAWADDQGGSLYVLRYVNPSFVHEGHVVRLRRVAQMSQRVVSELLFAGSPEADAALRAQSPRLGIDLEEFVIGLPFTCASCEGEHPAGTFVCPEDNSLLVCLNCNAHNVRTFTQANGNMLCDSCGVPCQFANCDAYIANTWTRCEAHAGHDMCIACRRSIEWYGDDVGPLIASSGGAVCEDCAEYVCHGCNAYVGEDGRWVLSEEHGRICQNCERQKLRFVFEQSDAEQDGLALEVMPTIPGRESIRKCGIEIEGINGTHQGRHLATELYREGLSHTDAMQGYHSSNHGFAKVERDSSVDWEAVLGPLNMANGDDVFSLNRTVKLIRGWVHDEKLKFNLQCGLHIHVSAEAVGLEQAYNLSHLFAFMEDPLFRLGAAKWPMHRACHGNGARVSIPKYDRKTQFFATRGGNGGSHDDHYYALSFQNYFHAMQRNCGCGAVQNGFWDECTCPELGKCTFEFRLFNTTANPRKLLAYLALCQALVAKAIEMPKIRRPQDEFPGMPFLPKILKSMTEDEGRTLVSSWEPRLRYIMTELPLTTEERSAVAYCARNSELADGLGDRLDDILSVETVTEEVEVAA